VLAVQKKNNGFDKRVNHLKDFKALSSGSRELKNIIASITGKPTRKRTGLQVDTIEKNEPKNLKSIPQ